MALVEQAKAIDISLFLGLDRSVAIGDSRVGKYSVQVIGPAVVQLADAEVSNAIVPHYFV